MIDACSSPHFDERKLPVSLLVLHYTGMQSGQEALARLCDAASKVSAHYLVEEDGRVFSLVEESKRAWHAGVSYWRGITDINSASIGIEIVNPGHEFGLSPFPQAQMDAVRDLCRGILSRHIIEPRNVVGHSDVAPERKQDPGELFNWQWLAENGVGLFPNLSPWERSKSSQMILGEGDAERLTHYGYNPAAPLHATITAFQRHFRPAVLTGEWDDECGRILAALLEMV